MTNERIKDIDTMVARKKILDTKIPSIKTPAFEKWVKESAEELGISCGEFAEYAQIALQEAFDEVKNALGEFKVKKKRFGFLPISSVSEPGQK